MKLPSTMVRTWVVDILEHRGTLEEVEPGLHDEVAEAVNVYKQPREMPANSIDEASQPDTPDSVEEVDADGTDSATDSTTAA